MPPAIDDRFSPRQRERLRDVFAALPANPFYARKFAGRGPDDFAELPLTTKAELVADQAEHPPYGSARSKPLAAFTRLHQSSGTTTGRPLRWLDTPDNWDWMLGLWRYKFRAMGLMPGEDRFYFPFSFGPFLGFWTAFEAASRLGFLSVPGGGLSSAARLKAMFEHRATVVCCTPTYALHLAEVARSEGIDLPGSSVRSIVVAGEPGGSIATTRQLIEQGWGARVFDHYGLTEVGPIAVECVENPLGCHVLEYDYIPEILDPASGTPVAAGEVGELVVTNLGRIDSPLIRYRTGDLVRADTMVCPCGLSYLRLAGGILGRTDDMIHVRGNNIYPAALEAVIRRFAVAEYRLTIDRRGSLTELLVEVEPMPGASDVAAQVSRAIRDELLFRTEVREVPPGILPRFEMKAKRISHR
ncbi:MAG: AMP-binding protein [Gemmataceae bacterium]